MEDTRNR